MKRLTNGILAISAVLMLAACGGQQSATPVAGNGSAKQADLPPRLQEEGAASSSVLPPYAPKDDVSKEPLLSDAPVVGSDGMENETDTMQNGEPGARNRAAAGQGASAGDDQPRVAALIPNRGPYTPVRELERIHFGYDTDELTMQAKVKLDHNVQWLLAHPEVRVRVEGHCDERGTNEYNLGLGQRRADRVVNYLTAQGVSARNLLAVSFGEEVPLVFGHDEKAWSQNRRVDFSYLDDNSTGQLTSSGVVPISR